MPASETALPLRIGARTLWTVRRRLVRLGLGLAEALAGEAPELPPLGREADGYLVTGLPAAAAPALAARHEGLKAFVRQRYARSYADLGQGFEAWLAGLSARSRSTLKRKSRKLAERSGGTLDLRCYRTAAEMEEFHRSARVVSALTYQERLLGAGLPNGPEALAAMRALAGEDRVRAWLLFVGGRPVSYLYAPAEAKPRPAPPRAEGETRRAPADGETHPDPAPPPDGDPRRRAPGDSESETRSAPLEGETLVYAYLGYDPDFADASPGTVLQLEAMRQLMEERRFRLFDFTEGDGQHKRLFATGSVECVDLLLVKPTPANLLAAHALNGFDGAIGLAKRAAGAAGAAKWLRRLRR
ncbi:MAG TPA: GNAT family N-acetyltransferase [Allosphingosinicella sp.]|nr:GNAT family N-acetyltransferase [Allosphingosinicella sp.]